MNTLEFLIDGRPATKAEAISAIKVQRAMAMSRLAEVDPYSAINAIFGAKDVNEKKECLKRAEGILLNCLDLALNLNIREEVSETRECLDLALSLDIRKEVSETRECLVRLYLIQKKKMEALEQLACLIYGDRGSTERGPIADTGIFDFRKGFLKNDKRA